MTDAVVQATHSYRARWVVRVVGEALDGGAVTVVDGRIASIDRHAPAGAVDLGDVALLPAWINAHCHLEFSELTQPLGEPGQPLPDWIKTVIAWKRGRTTSSRGAIEQGLRESHAGGVAAIGEIGTGDAWDATLVPPLDVTVFQETICLHPDRFVESMQGAKHFINERSLGATWQTGLSPHAPYTVHPELLDHLLDLAARRQLPVAMHLAESREELELLASGQGALRSMLDGVGIIWPAEEMRSFRRPLAYLERLARAPRSLVVHGNYLASDEIAYIAQQRERMTVVYCPRTHAYFQHERHPLVELLHSGAAVAIGTDGRGSNPDLDLLAELRCVAREFPELSPRKIIELGTIDGARALGIHHRLGSLEVGKQAAFVAVPLDSVEQGDPYAAILSSSGSGKIVL